MAIRTFQMETKVLCINLTIIIKNKTYEFIKKPKMAISPFQNGRHLCTGYIFIHISKEMIFIEPQTLTGYNHRMSQAVKPSKMVALVFNPLIHR